MKHERSTASSVNFAIPTVSRLRTHRFHGEKRRRDRHVQLVQALGFTSVLSLYLTNCYGGTDFTGDRAVKVS
jgi:hypothetical protein